MPLKTAPLLKDASYYPDALLDGVSTLLNVKHDAALAKKLDVAPPVISKIRHRRLPVGASILIRMHEVSNLSVGELRELLGDRRKKFRLSPIQGMPREGGNRPE